MTTPALPQPLRGIVPPMVTPLIDRDTLDEDGLARLIEYILAGGPSALFILGSTGEAMSLSHRLRHEIIERACQLVADRVPVLVGVSDTSAVESLRMANKAADAGADAVVLSTPAYFLVSQAELLAYFQFVVPQMPLPVLLYNIPSLTKLSIEPATVRAAAELANVVGLKDTSRDMIYFHRVRQVLKDRPEFTLLVGAEQLLAEAVVAGAHGGVNSGANLHPRLYVDLYDAAADLDLQRAAALHDAVMQLSGTIYAQSPFGGNIKGIKCALAMLGICRETMAEPFAPLDDAGRQRVRQGLIDLELL